jgi:hypothetical protein
MTTQANTQGMTHASNVVFNALKTRPVAFLKEMYQSVFTDMSNYDADVAGGIYTALEYTMGVDAADEWATAMMAQLKK